MPIYEFKCLECEKEFDELVMPGKDTRATCPQCRSENCEKLISIGNVRPQGIPKGSGGYTPPPCHQCPSKK